MTPETESTFLLCELSKLYSFFSRCGRRQPAPETVRPVKVVTASGAGVIDKDFAGMATPDDAVNLAFKLSGQVLDVPVSQGESVKKGALLAELP